MNYKNSLETLIDRIFELIPENLEILDFDQPWALFSINEFKVDDLSPSYMQAAVALNKAKERYNEQGTN